MVGTGRFELPTPRTPSDCSTRLSHVPTGKTTSLVYTTGAVASSVSGRNVFLGKRRSLAEKVLLHLLYQKLLRFPRPGLQAVLIQQHLLPLDPLPPCLFRDLVVNLVAKITVKGG